MKTVSSLEKIKHQVPLAPLTTLGVGGVAENYLEINELSDLAGVLAVSAAQNIYILGGGSNVLVSDAGLSGLVLHIKLLGRKVEYVDDEVLVTIGAGENLDEVIAWTVREGWGGLENLSLIPGTVGATPVQNVGAYGVEVSDLIESVSVWDAVAGGERKLAASDCHFAYRHSVFKTAAGKNLIVTAVTFRLQTKPVLKTSYADIEKYLSEKNIELPDIKNIREAVISIRKQKFPNWGRGLGTAGSFFKNPIVENSYAEHLKKLYPELPVYPVDSFSSKVSLAFILDKVLFLKGYRVGNVSLYEKQPLILVTHKGSTADEVDNFATDIAAKVLAATEIKIEREVREWGV